MSPLVIIPGGWPENADYADADYEARLKLCRKLGHEFVMGRTPDQRLATATCERCGLKMREVDG